MRVALLMIMLLFACAPALAQELYYLGGSIKNPDTGDSSYSWQLEYMHILDEHFAASLSYLNEGHLPNHHRDGNSLQLWTRANLLDRRLSLAAGAGPYYYFDSKRDTPQGSGTNEHDVGGMISLAATWYTDSRWLFQLRTNWVGIGRSFDTLSAVAGIGYQLDTPSELEQRSEGPLQGRNTKNNALTLFLGQTIVNSLNSSQDVAMGIEYRRGLGRYLDWTAAWLYEADDRLIRHNGMTTQLWAVRPFLEDRLSLGVGGGVYVTIDHYHGLVRGGNTGKLFTGIYSLTGSYRLYPHWEVRTSWNRIITNYNMDTDVILGGIGYCF